MPYKVVDLPHFQKQINILKKRFSKIEADINMFARVISVCPARGSRCQLGEGHEDIYLYKDRLKDSSSRIGARGGFRVLYLVDAKRCIVVPCAIYHKRDTAQLNHGQILSHVEGTLLEYKTYLQRDRDLDLDGSAAGL